MSGHAHSGFAEIIFTDLPTQISAMCDVQYVWSRLNFVTRRYSETFQTLSENTYLTECALRLACLPAQYVCVDGSNGYNITKCNSRKGRPYHAD